MVNWRWGVRVTTFALLTLGTSARADSTNDWLFSSSWTVALTTIAPFGWSTHASRDRQMRAAQEEKLQFVEKNYDHLMEDIARGGGEYLSDLYRIMQCNPRPESVQVLTDRLRDDMERVIPAARDPKALLANIDKEANARGIAHIATCKFRGAPAS